MQTENAKLVARVKELESATADPKKAESSAGLFGGFFGAVGGGLSNAVEEASIGWRLGATAGLGAVGGGVSSAGIQSIDARFFQGKFSWNDVGLSAASGGLVSLPFGGADLAIENANTPWLNLVGASLAPVEGYAHTLTEQGINSFSRQTPGS